MQASPALVSASHLSVEALLGGISSAGTCSALDWIALIRKGIASSAVDSLTTAIHITQSELATALGIPIRTLARRKKEGILSSEESTKVLRLARVVERAEQVFENLDIATHWLKSPNTALAGATPLSLLDTDIGAESVLDTLGRIEHGVFA